MASYTQTELSDEKLLSGAVFRYVADWFAKKRGSWPGFLVVMICSTSAIAQDDESFNLTLMHTNDTHSHHQPQGRTGNGGAARQATVVNAIRESAENSVLLDAGDRFTGTLFHQYYQGVDNIRIMNALGYDAMAVSYTHLTLPTKA